MSQPTVVRPYGDTTGDGMVQVSFTLPVPHDKRAEGAALQLAGKMGLAPALLVHARAVGPAHTFFMDRLADAFRVELGTFCEVAAGRAENPCTVEDAMGTAWTAEAATLSLREGRPVRITPDGLA